MSRATAVAASATECEDPYNNGEEGRGMFRSQIRHSEITALLEKVRKRSYGTYLTKMTLRKVRGFQGEPITFDFPVTAIIGPNGGGKTTVLGAAACAYKAVQPKRFFAKSGKYDESMQDWTIEHELIDRGKDSRDTIKRTARFARQRWNRDALDRKTLVFGVSRTVPAIERKELSSYASNNFVVKDQDIHELSADVASAVSKILDKDVSAFRRMEVDSRGTVTLLTGATKTGTTYSEFHFGAGESSIIRMVNEIESIVDDEQPLIIIEEIENGLHPVATIRMVEYLIDVAQRKGVQCIFSTHSNDALKPLPNEAIWTATNDRLFQGKLDIASLRAITGQVEQKLAIFVEDDFAKMWLEAMLRQQGYSLDHIGIFPMQGDGTAVKMNEYHNRNPALTVKSICIIDGDSKEVNDAEKRIFRLPGAAPELVVFEQVLAKWPLIGGKVSVGLFQELAAADRIKVICDDTGRQCRDHHLLFAQLGEHLNMIPASSVAMAFVNQWAQAYPELVENLLNPLASSLPRETPPPASGSSKTEGDSSAPS